MVIAIQGQPQLSCMSWYICLATALNACPKTANTVAGIKQALRQAGQIFTATVALMFQLIVDTNVRLLKANSYIYELLVTDIISLTFFDFRENDLIVEFMTNMKWILIFICICSFGSCSQYEPNHVTYVEKPFNLNYTFNVTEQTYVRFSSGDNQSLIYYRYVEHEYQDIEISNYPVIRNKDSQTFDATFGDSKFLPSGKWLGSFEKQDKAWENGCEKIFLWNLVLTPFDISDTTAKHVLTGNGPGCL